MAALRAAFERKADEFADVLKVGRTQLQDAMPMTLGQEFSSYATTLEEDEARPREDCSAFVQISGVLKRLAVKLFLFVTAPVSANLLAKAALHLRVPSKAPVPPDQPHG